MSKYEASRRRTKSTVFCVKMKCIVFQEKQGQLVAMRDQIEVFKKKKTLLCNVSRFIPQSQII